MDFFFELSILRLDFEGDEIKNKYIFQEFVESNEITSSIPKNKQTLLKEMDSSMTKTDLPSSLNSPEVVQLLLIEYLDCKECD